MTDLANPVVAQMQARVHQLEQQADADQQLIVNLQTALVSARRIGAAIGILMAQLKISDGAAFELLAEVSKATNRKLRDIAERVVLTGELPG